MNVTSTELAKIMRMFCETTTWKKIMTNGFGFGIWEIEICEKSWSGTYITKNSEVFVHSEISRTTSVELWLQLFNQLFGQRQKRICYKTNNVWCWNKKLTVYNREILRYKETSWSWSNMIEREKYSERTPITFSRFSLQHLPAPSL